MASLTSSTCSRRRSTLTLLLLLLPFLVVRSLPLVSGTSGHSHPPPLGLGLGLGDGDGDGDGTGATLTRTASEALRDALRTAEEVDALRMARVTSLPMGYGIFRGRSAVRDLLEEVPLPSSSPPRSLSEDDGKELERIRSLLHPEETFLSKEDAMASPLTTTTTTSLRQRKNSLRRLSSILLLLRGHPDAAHEVLLGVDTTNLDEAEYAATHPGETTWSSDHPLDDPTDDLIHAVIHRLEGRNVGEGNHTGFDNAGYWLGGGPKRSESPPPLHNVRRALADRARRLAPRCVAMGVVSPTPGGSEHRIIAGGGETRTVRVPPGEWDGFAFSDVCERRASGRLTGEEEEEVADLQRAELLLLLRTELVEAGLMAPSTAVVDDEVDLDADTDASS